MSQQHLTYNVTMFKETFEKEFTYAEGFKRNTHRYSDNKALTCPIRKETWTYSQLDGEANRLAHALIEDGVGKNDVVMYQLHNCSEFVFLYLAPQKIGAINCPINFRLSYGETAYIIDDSRPKVFFYDAAIREVAEKALSMASHKPSRVVMVDITGSHEPASGAVTYEGLCKR